jgi:cell division protease FtsH
MTDRERVAGNGHPVVPQDEAAKASDELPPERIGEVPE